MEVRLSKFPGPIKEWTTGRARDQVNDRIKSWERDIGNQFADPLW